MIVINLYTQKFRLVILESGLGLKCGLETVFAALGQLDSRTLTWTLDLLLKTR